MGSRAKPRKKAGSSDPAPFIADDSATEGQRLLRAVAASNAEIAAAVGASKSIVGFWRTGRKLPAPEMRRVLASLYDIAVGSWDARPGALAARAPASKPGGSAPIIERSKPTNREGAEAMLEAILKQREADGLTVQEFTRLVDAEAKARKLIHDFDQAEQLTETRIVQSTTMQKIRNAAIGALEPWPDALRAFLSALGVKA